MQIPVTFKYIFLAPGERTNCEWEVKGTYTVHFHPCYDLEGDLSNMPDVEECFRIDSIQDHSAGFPAGFLNMPDIDREHLQAIVRLGYKAGFAQIEKRNEQRKGNTAAVGHIH